VITSCKKPVLIVEGLGDKSAVPRLIREVCALNEIYDFNPAPRPKQNVELRKLRRTGELERYVTYAAQDDGDCVLIALDCEDFDPKDIFAEFCRRAANMDLQKKIAIALFRSEFETLFLYCLSEISKLYPEYEWIESRLLVHGEIERIRNAKGVISDAMRNRAYKPTRDQTKFISALNWEKLRANSDSFNRFEQTILWLAGKGNAAGTVFPSIL
jgi:hypothetical protein